MMKGKRILALLLCMALVAGATACGDTDGGNDVQSPLGGGETPTPVVENVDTLTGEDLSYVMIYNPKVYDENVKYDTSSLSTGSLGTQIDPDIFRGSGLDEVDDTVYFTPDDLAKDFDFGKVNLDGNRGDGLDPIYSVGDVHTFGCFDSTMNRQFADFTCLYVGQNCYIWNADNTMTQAQAAEMGQEFDSKVYGQVTEAFGTPRFTNNGGKVNLLFNRLQDGYVGCFYQPDIFASYEVSSAEIDQYKLTTGHAMLYINSLYLSYGDTIKSTMAHELQHNINMSNSIQSAALMRVWLNEAMSGYIEEKLYPGEKEKGHLLSLQDSDRIRHGQSMYNFTIDNSYYSQDIGVYGSVYLFSEYLADIAGDDVFSKIHAYWKDSYSPTLSEAEAIINSIPTSVYEVIDQSIAYPLGVGVQNKNEEWMSKLVLNFYLELLNKDADDPNGFQHVDSARLLYDEINSASIEGGGRIIAAIKNGTFTIPSDAESGLIYIGLDSDFNVVTDIIYK